MTNMSVHIPVLLQEVIHWLHVKPGDHVIDATVGEGGHAKALLERTAPDGHLLGIDMDHAVLKRAQSELAPFAGRFELVRGNFKDLKTIINEQSNSREHRAILCDLGVSSYELQDASRGFSFNADGPLDMRFAADADHPLTAASILNSWSEQELIDIFREIGEERHATRIAAAVIETRRDEPFETTDQLVRVIEEQIPRRGRIHPATRVFQALRITVNLELENLRVFLPAALDVVEPGGRIALISFHSLEDRIVKRFFRKQAQTCVCPPRLPICTCGHQPSLKILTKKPIIASEEEREENPRSRSAKLRVAEKIKLS